MLLDSGALVNLQDSHGKTALMLSRDPEITKLLINKGADVNLQDSHGNNALMFSKKTFLKNGDMRFIFAQRSLLLLLLPARLIRGQTSEKDCMQFRFLRI
ncbi:MAG: hypothetical protein AABX98_03235, partial [Nanoarchaeota archaeon]